MGVIDDLLAKEPEQRTVEFCLDHQLREALSTAQTAQARARNRLDAIPAANRDRVRELRDEIDAQQGRIDELIPQVQANLVRFTFQAIAQDDFDELKGQHRPTEPQRTAARKAKRPEPDFNEDTFPPVLIAATCVRIQTPSGTADGLSLEDAQRLWASDRYNDAERNELFNSALAAQLTRIGIDLPKGG